MTAALAHRGPDGSDVWLHDSGRVGLGHTRLAVIDLVTGDQPMHSSDGRFTIVLNGEIYNYRDLRRTLGTLGHQWQSDSDTEVLMNAYREWGTDAFQKLHGMFAVVIFDAADDTVVMARDRTGIKPLYVFRDDNRLIAASELKAILCDSNVPRRLHLPALAQFLTLSYSQLPGTFYQDIEELKPGTWLRFGTAGTEQGCYWRWQREPREQSFADSVESAKTALIESVEEHLVADVPIGAFLSSGIDSTLVCAIAARELGYDLHAFTVGYDGHVQDESPAARAIAGHLGIRHTTLSLRNDALDLEHVLSVLRQYDQPFGDSSAVPAFLLSGEIAKHVKVVLSGDGGDEVFGGYTRFFHADAVARLRAWFGHALWAGVPLTSVVSAFSPGAGRIVRRLLSSALQRDADRLTWLASYVSNREYAAVFTPAVLAGFGDLRPSVAPGVQAGEPDGSDYMDATIEHVLPGDYLRKMDVASSAHGLEVRVPFLGNQVLDASSRMPLAHFYDRRLTKKVARALLAQYVPDELMDRPKAGFSIPLIRVLSAADRRKLADTVLTCEPLLQLLRPDYLNSIASAFAERRWDQRRHSEFMIYQRFYALLALSLWLTEQQPDLGVAA